MLGFLLINVKLCSEVSYVDDWCLPLGIVCLALQLRKIYFDCFCGIFFLQYVCMYILLFWLVYSSIDINSYSWSSMFSTLVVLLLRIWWPLLLIHLLFLVLIWVSSWQSSGFGEAQFWIQYCILCWLQSVPPTLLKGLLNFCHWKLSWVMHE